MKPLRLELEAFGSYPGTEVVDFTVLARRGLFVVTGPTGTGKTTIFDAMCFALYGVMPRKGAGEARSHHADPHAATVVRFDFEVDGERYTVTRSPEYERPAKRGGQMTVERAQAQLVRHRDDGTTASLATKVRAVTDECTRLLGLGAEQFQRVVLLPQGEVARFLTAGSDERADLLGTLFGGAVYQGLVEELRQRSSALEREVADTAAALQATLDTAHQQVGRLAGLLDPASSEPDVEPGDRTAEPGDRTAEEGADEGRPADRRVELGHRLAAMASSRQALVEQARALRDVSDEAARRYQLDDEAARRFDLHGQIAHRLTDLEQQWPDIEAAAEAARISVAARPVVSAADHAERSCTALDDARAARAALQRRLDESFTALGVEPAPHGLSEMTALVAEVRADQDRRRAQLAALAGAEAALALEVGRRDDLQVELARIERSLDETQAQAAVVEARLNEIGPHLVDPASLRARIAALAELADHRRTYERLLGAAEAATESAVAAAADHAGLFAQFVATEAPRLATQLVPGEPCAVCGSMQHPRPALADEREPTSFDDVTAAAARRDACERERARLETELGVVVDRLGEHLRSSVDELVAAGDAVTAELAVVEAVHDEHRILAADLARLGAEQARLSNERSGVVGRVGEVEHVVASRADELDRARVAAADIDRTELDRVDEVVAELGRRVAEVADADRSVDAAQAAADAAQQRSTEAIAASPFTTVDEARGAVLEVADEQHRLDTAQRLRNELAEQRGALQAVLEQGVPAERPDVDALRDAAGASAAAARTAADVASRAGSLFDEAQSSLDEHDRRLAASGQLHAAAAAAQRAYHVCAFGGALRMSVRRWVLAQELDRVTAAANVHLARMTAGRYSLQRQIGVVDKRRSSGLELEVLDAHTGRPRSTSSLSGGEQFQASLALALGLADVVSHGASASGRVFEALFVDEGFGSLDQDALRDAIDTLHQLQATGRMVGAITHVEAMKQELHPGIEVFRRDDGRGSTLVVNP